MRTARIIRAAPGGRVLLLLLAAHLRPVAPAAAQDPAVIPRASSPIVLDGRVDEAAWSEVPPLPLVMFAPEYRGRPTERTEIRVAHDGEYLYAAARFFDSSPQDIRANGLVRDDAAEDDFFNLVLDTFRDGENAVWFLVTPTGNRVDGAITGNAEGTAWNHFEYDSFWDAAAHVGEHGWSAEMRIPFASLRFERSPSGDVEMGLIAGRFIARRSERHVFPDLRPGPAVAQYKPSLAAPVRLEGVEPHAPLYVRPYLLAGLERESGTGPGPGSGSSLFIREVGGDVKVGISSGVTLDLTLNTDFAQTEADDERINLTRYGLFFPEKRAFFLERTGTFALDAGEDVRLFHSRTLGLDDAGNRLRVRGGGRLVGRLGSWDVGFLDMQIDAPLGGGQNAGVLRARRNVGGTDSYLGAIVTSLAASGERTAVTAGLDGSLRIAGDDFVSFAAGVTPEDGGRVGLPQLLGRIVLERRNQRGWRYRGDVTHVGSGFDPSLGFVLRGGLTTSGAAVGYGWFGGKRFQASGFTVDGTLARRHAGGTESARVQGSWFGDRRGGGRGLVDVAWHYEGLLEPFALGDVTIPAGGYRFVDGRLSVETPGGRTVTGVGELSGGAFYDGYRVTAAVAPTWAASPHLELGARAEASRVWFPARDQEYRGVVTSLRARVSASTSLGLQALVQHNSAADATTVNVRARYTIRDGNDVYVVFSSGRLGSYTGGSGGDVASWRRESLLLKYSAAIR